MGIGSFFSKFFHKNLLNTFVEIEILVGLIGGLSSVVLFLLFENVGSFQFILYLFVFVTGFLVGLEIPLLMNILKDRVEFKDLVSNVFTFDYIGALLASILFPLVLVPKLGIMGTSLFFGMINVSIAIALCFLLEKELKKVYFLKVKAIFSFVLLLAVFVFSNDILAYSEGKLYGENIIYTNSTPYQRIVLTHNKSDYRLYLNNNLQFSSADEYRYHEALVHPAMSMAKSVKNVLVLGGGDGLAVREILKYKDVEKVTLVDLDAGMTKLFKTNTVLTNFNQNSLNNSKVAVINTDAYIWAKSCKEKFDVAKSIFQIRLTIVWGNCIRLIFIKLSKPFYSQMQQLLYRPLRRILRQNLFGVSIKRLCRFFLRSMPITPMFRRLENGVIPLQLTVSELLLIL